MSEIKKIKIHVGLDFGTYQTKVCLRFRRSDVAKAEYHFVPLNDAAEGLDRLFLPSVVTRKPDGTLLYGQADEEAGNHLYTFFKIASAEDEEFRVEIDQSGSLKYNPSRFRPYTPEFLAAIYLTNVINLTKQYVKTQLFKPEESKPTSGFLSRFRKTQIDYQFDWTIQMGVPTEYQQAKNAQRKRKFQQILWMANDLSERYSVQDFSVLTDEELKLNIQDIFEKILNEIHYRLYHDVNEKLWNWSLDKRNLSVYPETAAGLVFLVRTGKVAKNRYYLALDIGGGSTDISFFKVEDNETFTYLASKSLMIATNDIAMQMCDDNKSNMRLRQIVDRIFSDSQIVSEKVYCEAFKRVVKAINKGVYRMFNDPVYFSFRDRSANEKFNHATCYLYGGGAGLPVIQPNPESLLKSIKLYDNGNPLALDDNITLAEVKSMDNLTLSENIVPSDWHERMRFLIVPLGLSLSMSDKQTTEFNEAFYTPAEISKVTKVFDIQQARWV